jgi:glutamine---fructose-6-phosphate transaminase (isomerizing)
MEDATKPAPRWISGVEPPKELLSATTAQIMTRECHEQPARLCDLLRACKEDSSFRAELRKLTELAKRWGPVLFIGMGASFCSSVSGSIFLQSHGRLSFSVEAGEWLHYGSAAWNEVALSVLLTTSGESAELVELFKVAGDRPLGLICNNPSGPCWKLAMNKLPLLAGPEYGNATKTYTNATALSVILASEILGRPWEADAKKVEESFAANLDSVFALRGDLENFCRGAVNTEVIGRGAAYGAAIMGALSIREMTGHRAAVHTGAGFRHGPNLDVDASHVAIIFALGRTAALGIKLARECNERGGKVVLVSSEDHPATDHLFPIKITAVPEGWEGITSFLVPQALTLGMVEKHGSRLPPRFQYGVMEQ